VRSTFGFRLFRLLQQMLCQWRRVSASCSSHATVCGVAIGIIWSHPGHRYGLFEVEPLIKRTTKMPSSCSSIDSFDVVNSRSLLWVTDALRLLLEVFLRVLTGLFSQSI